jgi:hypothetical protein
MLPDLLIHQLYEQDQTFFTLTIYQPQNLVPPIDHMGRLYFLQLNIRKDDAEFLGKS